MPERRLLAASAALAAVLTLAGLSGCSPSAPTNPPASAPASNGSNDPGSEPVVPGTVVPVATPVRVAVVGDSNSTGHKGDIDTGIATDNAWIAQVGTADVDYVGGWAEDGATSARMAQNVKPVDNADVVVIMAGTNDLAAGVTLDQLNDDVTSIVDTVGAKNVVIAAIPPISAKPDYPTEANASLKALAASKGWFFHDSWVDLRTATDGWVKQYMRDGIHTTKAGYAVFGRDMGEFIVTTFAAK